MLRLNSLADSRLRTGLCAGCVVALPTDTVYGIVAVATDKTAVRKLYELKGRAEGGKPGTVIAASKEQLCALGIAKSDLDVVADLWPGPVSIVLPAGEPLAYLHQGQQSLAVRIPDDPVLLDLLIKTGPLLTSSCNLPGKSPATNAEEAEVYFGDTVDMYIQGHNTQGRIASTVGRLLPDGTIETLRSGPVNIPDAQSTNLRKE